MQVFFKKIPKLILYFFYSETPQYNLLNSKANLHTIIN